MSETREIGRMWTRADVVPESINEEARTVDVVWTTGARVKRYSWFDGPWYEELSTDPAHVRMGRLASGRAPVLLQHNSINPNAHQGVVERAQIANGQGTATLRFLKDDVDADKTWNKIRQRILATVSVGYDIHKMEKIEGGDETVPVYRATDWEPYEISPVSMPADPDAVIRSESAREHRNTCLIITRGDAAQQENRMPEEKNPALADDAARQAELEAARTAERERAETINALVRTHNLDAKFGDEMIRSGKPLADVRALVLDKLAERSNDGTRQAPSGAVEVGTTAEDKQRASQVAWLIERAGMSGMVESAREHKTLGRHFRNVVLDPGAARGLSMLDMARDFLERNQVSTRGMTKMELAGRALSFRGGFQGKDTFPVLFEEALHKLLLAAYATTPDTWRLFCGTDTVPDFRDSIRYRTGELAGTLDTLTENGEFKHKAISDGSKTAINTETRGNLLSLTRQAIINDDMGALADTATKFGRMAARSIEVDVYALLGKNSGLGPTLGDGNPLFHASRGNVNATGSALTVAGLDADRVVFRSQKDPNGADYLDITPAVLVLPVGLGGEARVLNNAQFEPTDNKFQKPNRVAGLFRTIVDTPRLSGTRRYLFADPSIVPVIKVVFLEGQGEALFMDMEQGFEVDGTTWKVRTDFKVQAFDPKGAVTNAGA